GVCAGTTSASLPYTATTGSPDQYSITYSAAAITAGFVNVGLTALPASPISLMVPAGAGAGTYSGPFAVKNSATGCSCSGSAFTVWVIPTFPTRRSSDLGVCAGTTSASLPYTATTGSPNQYSITYSAAAITAGFVNVGLTALPASPITLVV